MIFVPLSQLYFDDAGVLNHVLALSGEAPALTTLLNFLNQSGQLTPADVPPPQAAMIIAAAGDGPVYNGVTIELSSVSGTDPALAAFDIDVSKTETYIGLNWADTASPDYVSTVLGKGTTAGTKPSLVRVKTGDIPAKPKAISKNLSGGLLDIGDGSTFNLKAFAGGDTTVITTSNIVPASNTFDLTVYWHKKVTVVKKSQLPPAVGADAELATMIKVSDPPAPAGPGVPRAGTVVLAGGADAIPAVPAGVTVYTP